MSTTEGYKSGLPAKNGYEPTPVEELKPSASMQLVQKADDLPSKVDFSQEMSPIKNQNHLPSCVAFGLLSALDLVPQTIGLTDVHSEAFTWYWAQKLQGKTPSINSGTTISKALGALLEYGSCWESKYPYPGSSLPPPPENAQAQAYEMRVRSYSYLGDPTDMNAVKTLLAAGVPVVIGFPMYGKPDYWEKWIYNADSTSTGYVNLPPDDPPPARTDGHVVTLVGYDDNVTHYDVANSRTVKGYFKFKNSWGADKGDKGWYYLPYEFFRNVDTALVFETQQTLLPNPLKKVESAIRTTTSERSKLIASHFDWIGEPGGE
ncbi:cysteine proteinase [Aspergillus homomorphus CBS 101889]|uniref:Cysteine proteinase n=1 Tax=Aspergillus homomorphus (strain CBS 101889) TaxID=1450537 RepID=A0A395HUU9_ASPHC|nr:cysteine proteinase [Aspergillus homomorphus CBS 101889]RAL11193.1 cysteine proteinase [Aspergillus homomorphus CBS 101889]